MCQTKESLKHSQSNYTNSSSSESCKKLAAHLQLNHLKKKVFPTDPI